MLNRIASLSLCICAFAVLTPATSPADPSLCPADINDSGVVDAGDLSVLLVNFGLLEADYEDGDVSMDGQVDLEDLVLVLSAFGRECDPPLPCPGDMNRNHIIDVSDLAVLLANFGLRPAQPQDGDMDGDLDVDLTDLVILSLSLNLPCEPELADCTLSESSWINEPLFPQSEVFAISFDAVPYGTGIDGLTALAANPVEQYSDLAVAVRFNVDGFIDARDGSQYRADVGVPYEADTIYTFRVVVDIPSSRYTVFVTTPAHGEVLLGQDLAFRTEQNDIDTLRYLSVQSGRGEHDTCNVALLSSENLPPIVDAGVNLETTTETAALSGVAIDDGQPNGTLTTTWSQVSGPAAAGFADANALTTDVTLPAEGSYVLRLTASDSDLSASDLVTVTRTPPPPPQLEVSPATLQFSIGDDARTFLVGMSGVGTLAYTISDDAGWLSVNPTAGDTSGESDSITATVNRAGLADGSYTATISVHGDNGATETVAVTLLVGSAAPMDTASRTTGIAPLAVYFDATDPDSGVLQPALVNGRREYADLHYQWDFGDGNGETWPVNGAAKNAATGYNAAHVYETPGTYIATLLVVDPDSGASQVYSQVIEVLPFTGTTYYVSTSGSDSNAGTSTGSPLRTVGRAMSLAGSNTRILLKRGETWSIPGGVTIDRAGPGIVGAYAYADGSDDRALPRPRILVSNGGAHGIQFVGWSADVSDWRVMDLEVVGPGGGGAGDGVRGNGTLQRATLLRLDLRDFYVGVLWSYWAVDHTENTIAECEISGMHHNGAYVGGSRHAFLGNVIGSPTNEHILRVWYMDRGVYSHNYLATAPRHQIKLHKDVAAGTPSDSRYNVFTDNTFVGGSAWSVTIGPQDEFSNEIVSDTLLERNVFLSQGGQVQRACAIWARYTTIRNNVFYADGSAPWYEAITITQRAGEGAPRGNRVLNNTCHRGESSSEFRFCRIGGGAINTEVRNNLVSAASAPLRVLLADGSGQAQASNNLLTFNAGFVNAGAGNLHLRSDSIAIDGGYDVGVMFDFDQNGRFDAIVPDSGDGEVTYYDIGAFEYQGE